jgi:hypothetical protein
MPDVKGPKERVEVGEHTNEGMHGRDLTRESAKREKLPSFIERPMRDAGLLQEGQSLTKSADLKNLVEKEKKENPIQYEQAKYSMMKNAISDYTPLKSENIKQVQKIEDGYAFKFEDGFGTEDGKISLKDHKEAIEAFEKQMADHGFQIEEPKSDSIKQAVLKQAAEKAAPDGKALIESGAVQSYHPQSEKWYILKDGQIKEFSLDNKKIEQDAELDSVKKHLRLKNGDDIVEAKFKNGQYDQYEVRGTDPSQWETIAKKDLEQSIMHKIMGETKITPTSEVTVIESRETKEEAKLRDIDELINDLKNDRERIEKWGKQEKRVLTGAIFLNQGFAQADQNLNVIEEAMQLGGGNNAIMPSTIQNSEKVLEAIDTKHKNKVENIGKQIEHLEKYKVAVNKQKEKLKSEKEKYEKLKQDLRSSHQHTNQNQDTNRKDKQSDET